MIRLGLRNQERKETWQRNLPISRRYGAPATRLRTQHTIHIILSHLHYAFKTPRADYQDRVCPHCLDKGTTVLGDEIHIIFHCPATQGVLQKFTAKFQELTPLLDLLPFASFTPTRRHEWCWATLHRKCCKKAYRAGSWKQLQSAVSLHMPSAYFPEKRSTPLCHTFALYPCRKIF